MILSGIVLWYSDRDGNGIIIDNLKNEYYFDSKTLFKRNQIVLFNVNEKIKDCLCAVNVKINREGYDTI